MEPNPDRVRSSSISGVEPNPVPVIIASVPEIKPQDQFILEEVESHSSLDINSTIPEDKPNRDPSQNTSKLSKLEIKPNRDPSQNTSKLSILKVKPHSNSIRNSSIPDVNPKQESFQNSSKLSISGVKQQRSNSVRKSSIPEINPNQESSRNLSKLSISEVKRSSNSVRSTPELNSKEVSFQNSSISKIKTSHDSVKNSSVSKIKTSHDSVKNSSASKVNGQKNEEKTEELVIKNLDGYREQSKLDTSNDDDIEMYGMELGGLPRDYGGGALLHYEWKGTKGRELQSRIPPAKLKSDRHDVVHLDNLPGTTADAAWNLLQAMPVKAKEIKVKKQVQIPILDDGNKGDAVPYNIPETHVVMNESINSFSSGSRVYESEFQDLLSKIPSDTEKEIQIKAVVESLINIVSPSIDDKKNIKPVKKSPSIDDKKNIKPIKKSPPSPPREKPRKEPKQKKPHHNKPFKNVKEKSMSQNDFINFQNTVPVEQMQNNYQNYGNQQYQQYQNIATQQQIGILPPRTTAFQAPFVPLRDNPNYSPDGSFPNFTDDVDGLNFSFNPRANFATEVTFTVEPKKKPMWQTMLNCGFTPVIYCSVPPCCLPGGNQQSTCCGQQSQYTQNPVQESSSSEDDSDSEDSSSSDSEEESSEDEEEDQVVLKKNIQGHGNSHSTTGRKYIAKSISAKSKLAQSISAKSKLAQSFSAKSKLARSIRTRSNIRSNNEEDLSVSSVSTEPQKVLGADSEFGSSSDDNKKVKKKFGNFFKKKNKK